MIEKHFIKTAISSAATGALIGGALGAVGGGAGAYYDYRPDLGKEIDAKARLHSALISVGLTGATGAVLGGAIGRASGGHDQGPSSVASSVARATSPNTESSGLGDWRSAWEARRDSNSVAPSRPSPVESFKGAAPIDYVGTWARLQADGAAKLGALDACSVFAVNVGQIYPAPHSL